MVVDNRRSVLVQDEFDLTKSAELTFGLTTDASIQLINTREAEMTISGKKMTVRLLAPITAGFTIESARQALPQKENTGVNRLVIKIAAQVGAISVTVLMSPQWPSGTTVYTAGLVPLSNW